MPELESDLLQCLERMGGKVQWLEVSTRGRARGGAGILQPWLSFPEPTPAWEARSLRSTPLLRGATHTCRSTPPGDPTASAWWCVSNHLQTTTDRPCQTDSKTAAVHNKCLNDILYLQPANCMYEETYLMLVWKVLCTHGSVSRLWWSSPPYMWHVYLSWWKSPWNICPPLWVCVGHSPAAQWSVLYGLCGCKRRVGQTGQTTDLLDKAPARGPLWECGWSSEVRLTAHPPSLGGN